MVYDLNSKERILIALQHEEPDRVPLFEAWIEPEILKKLGGDMYSVRLKLGIDALPISHHPMGKTLAYGDGIDEWGRIFKNGQYAGGIVKRKEDIERFSPSLDHAENWFPVKHIRNIQKLYDEDYALYFAWHDCSLGLTYLSMGIENFFLGLYNDIDFIKSLIKRSTEWTIALVEQANDIVDFIVLGDDVADNNRPFISLQMFRELILPEYKKIARAAKVPIFWHSDGNIEPLIPLIIQSGFNGIHSLEPKANIDLAKIKRDFGDKLVLIGNLDTTEILCQQNLELIRKDVKRCIKQGAPGGGYLFSSSNSLFEGHNIRAIIEAYNYAKKIGRYPII